MNFLRAAQVQTCRRRTYRLTSQIITPPPPLQQLIRMRFIAPRRFAHSFVASREQYDTDERYDQRAGAADVPAAKHNAEVCRVPSEQHLQASQDTFGS